MKKNIIPEKMSNSTIICITVVLCIFIVGLFIYKKEELKQQEENQRLQEELEFMQEQKNLLDYCINQAEADRSSLWDRNCVQQSNGKCTIKSKETLDWIEKRYEQDIKNCNSLYGN